MVLICILQCHKIRIKYRFSINGFGWRLQATYGLRFSLIELIYCSHVLKRQLASTFYVCNMSPIHTNIPLIKTRLFISLTLIFVYVWRVPDHCGVKLYSFEFKGYRACFLWGNYVQQIAKLFNHIFHRLYLDAISST